MPEQPPANLTGINRWAAAVRKRQDWVCTGLFLLVAWVFLPAVGFDFTNYDDDLLLTMNPSLLNGWSESVHWAFSLFLGNWHPVTLMSHVVDYHLFGLEPWGHHLTNILLHAANATLLYLVLRRMTGATWRSLLVAALFGLHPLRVESVAWVATRTDCIGTFFWLLAIWAYLCFLDQTPRWSARGKGYYLLSIFLFFLALASKPMHVTLPCVLLLLDFWPLHRLSKATLLPIILEKIPYFLVSIGFCLITVVARQEAHSINSLRGIPLGLRLENVVISYCRYLGKLFYPVDLTLYYPFPDHWAMPLVLAAIFLLLVISFIVVFAHRKKPCWLMGWCWYLGTLVPVIGLVQIGSQAIADRYTYAPCIGVLIILVWSLGDLAVRRPRVIPAIFLTAIIAILVLSGLTRRQLSYWKNSETVWRRSIEVTPVNHLATAKLADYLSDQGRAQEAESLYRRALELAPNDAGTHNNLGLLLQSEGRDAEAIQHFEEVLQTHPDNAEAHLNLGAALSNQGRDREAEAHFELARKLAPADPMTWNNLGVALGARGRLDEAIKSFQLSLRINRSDASAWINLGFAFEQKKRLAEAFKAYERAIALQPNYPLAHLHLAGLLRDEDHLAEAVLQYREALRLLPDSAETHYQYGLALRKLDRRTEAAEQFQQALKFDPQLKAAADQLRAAEPPVK